MTTQGENQTGRQQAESDAMLKRLRKGIIHDLPTTFQPYFNQQVRTWDNMFPYERRYFLDVLAYLDRMVPDQRSKLFDPILKLEQKMDVSHWNFSVEGETLQDASLLARSPYYQQWRQAVQGVFTQIDSAMQQARKQSSHPRRLILMVYPECLPFEPGKVWQRWPEKGKTFRIASGGPGDKQPLMEALLGTGGPAQGPSSARLLDALARRAKDSFADVWALDAGSDLSEFILGPGPGKSRIPGGTLLSFDRLRAFRQHYLDEVNTMNHSLSSADQILSRIKKEDVSRFCPAEINNRPIVREFVRSLFMTGNGSPVSGNPFVQWGAAEAFRRARPSVLVGWFGTRNKPKPFTSVAVFVNQSIASPLPSVVDYPGSAIDASMLSYYVWLSSTRYPEYQDALTVCIAGSTRTAYVIGPERNPFQGQAQSFTLDQVSRALGGWLSSPS